MDFSQLCQTAAKRHGVTPDVHPADHMFRFLVENPVFNSQGDAVNYYFDDGARSYRKLLDILTDVCHLPRDRPIRLLEFASGYGCVTRHARSLAPCHTVTACDIHPEAVRFIQQNLNTEAILSNRLPESCDLAPDYDVVFALSFFSHMPKQSFGRWLNRLARLLNATRSVPGWLIFTTHGLLSRKYMGNCSLDEEGFWFQSQSEQRDIDGQDYGSTLTRPDYVLKQVLDVPGASLACYRDGFWWDHQDLWVLRIEGCRPL